METTKATDEEAQSFNTPEVSKAGCQRAADPDGKKIVEEGPIVNETSKNGT